MRSHPTGAAGLTVVQWLRFGGGAYLQMVGGLHKSLALASSKGGLAEGVTRPLGAS
jgi:hypothetical protein